MNIPRPSRTFFRALACSAALFACAAAPRVHADAATEWKAITDMDAGPEGNAPTRDVAKQLMTAHFDKVEQALRAYIAAYPSDAHLVDARLRLSHLLIVRSELENKPKAYTEGLKIMSDLEADRSLSPENQADVAYARITLYMHRVPRPTPTQREALVASIRSFQRKYPADARNGALFVEAATLYDEEPKTKRQLLSEALRYADEEMKERINDDFKRLDMLGKPVDLKFDSVQGEATDIANYRGKVVLVYFFANWSSPSAAGLAELRGIAGAFKPAQFQVIGISLDKKRESLSELMVKNGITYPVYFDGKGWESPLARSLGINSLPTVWLVDRKGNLRNLNAIDNTEALIRQLLAE